MFWKIYENHTALSKDSYRSVAILALSQVRGLWLSPNKSFQFPRKPDTLGFLYYNQNLFSLIFSRPSVATLEFLKTDTNLPRTLFTLSITNIIAWLPFILLLLMAKFLIFDENLSNATLKAIFNGVLWWGFAQSPLTSALIYLLSDRVQFVLSGQFKGVTVASLHKRARLMSRRFTMSD